MVSREVARSRGAGNLALTPMGVGDRTRPEPAHRPDDDLLPVLPLEPFCTGVLTGDRDQSSSAERYELGVPVSGSVDELGSTPETFGSFSWRVMATAWSKSSRTSGFVLRAEAKPSTKTTRSRFRFAPSLRARHCLISSERCSRHESDRSPSRSAGIGGRSTQQSSGLQAQAPRAHPIAAGGTRRPARVRLATNKHEAAGRRPRHHRNQRPERDDDKPDTGPVRSNNPLKTKVEIQAVHRPRLGRPTLP